MISTLRIENFALIDKVEIQFNKGFTVITGETGSGKSILLNALNLILGERANFSVIGDRTDKSVVEAEIQIADFNLTTFFSANELDYYDQCIVRREVSKSGRSRAFINDTPVQLTTLKELTSQLIHIHSQYNTLELKDVQFQLYVLDVLSGNTADSSGFKKKYRNYLDDRRKLKQLRLELADISSSADYNAFQLSELEELQLDSFDYAKMQQELSTAENADDLKVCYSALANGLSTEGAVIDQLEVLKAAIVKLASSDEYLNGLLERINSALIELKDLSEDAEGRLEQIEIDPERFQELSDRINAFNRVLHKHNVTDQEGLMNYRDSLSTSALSSQELTEEVEKLQVETERQEKVLIEEANRMHENRQKAVPKIEQMLKEALNDLKLIDTEINFVLSKTSEMNETGCSNLEILFSPNTGIEPVPIHRAASGGELSRVMLALQSLMASKTKLQTILFDEIDTGVSGDVAQKVGVTLEKMGKGMQVIAITHLPQVAAKGGQHLLVAKTIVDGKTQSSVVELTMEQRIEETARLMSGDKINDAALENARALMS